MKIRSQEELVSFVDEQLAWRKKEIAAVAALADGVRSHQKHTLLRAGVALLYAHWEGFIKAAASAYCSYVRSRQTGYGRLRPSFLAVIVRNMLRGASTGRRIGPYLRVVDAMLNVGSGDRQLPSDNIIDTESNLTYEVFEDIAQTIGIDVAEFATKAKLIDEGLVARRHKIAHGGVLGLMRIASRS